jgi:hypothetical protein
MPHLFMNRAKCRLCKSVIESYHQYDYIACKCGEIAISGGESKFEVFANDFANIIRIDNDGKEINVKVVEKEKDVVTEIPSKTSREDLLKMLDDMIAAYDNLPSHALTSPVTHRDFESLLILVSSILRAI